jgi:GYF domain 2
LAILRRLLALSSWFLQGVSAMAEWYYTTNNQQMGPISWDELRQLASTGLLHPTDMVWKEGMVDWAKADRTDGLFSERAAPRREERYDEDRPRPRSRDSRDDDDYDDRPRRRRRPAASGMPLGAKVAIIGGSIAVGLLILVVIIVLLVRGGNSPVLGPNAYRITLFPRQENVRLVRFNAGQNVRITVTSQVTHPRTDVDLYVERSNRAPITADVAVSKDCFVNFVAPVTDNYRIRVVNLGPGNATSDVDIR